MKGLDLTKFDRTSHGFLEKREASKPKKVVANVNNKNVEPKKDVKTQMSEPKRVGRPQIDEEPLDKKVMLSLTASEFEGLEKAAGQVPMARYVRYLLRENKLI